MVTRPFGLTKGKGGTKNWLEWRLQEALLTVK
jgi:hypothetical protein